jgi:hypothetical protein
MRNLVRLKRLVSFSNYRPSLSTIPLDRDACFVTREQWDRVYGNCRAEQDRVHARLTSGPFDREEGGASGRQRCIDFRCPVPFKKFPGLIEQGFEKMEDLFGAGKGDERVLEECLNHFVCGLMLMMVLILASSFATPTMPVPPPMLHQLMSFCGPCCP